MQKDARRGNALIPAASEKHESKTTSVDAVPLRDSN
jgi:hypothetical protein